MRWISRRAGSFDWTSHRPFERMHEVSRLRFPAIGPRREQRASAKRHPRREASDSAISRSERFAIPLSKRDHLCRCTFYVRDPNVPRERCAWGCLAPLFRIFLSSFFWSVASCLKLRLPSHAVSSNSWSLRARPSTLHPQNRAFVHALPLSGPAFKRRPTRAPRERCEIALPVWRTDRRLFPCGWLGLSPSPIAASAANPAELPRRKIASP